MMANASTYYSNNRTEVAALLPAGYKHVLEIGCGEGVFRGLLIESCEYWGVEPCESAAEIAEKTLHKVLIGTFDDAIAKLPDAYFDLVVCNDVIEHMPCHDYFFERIKEKLKPDAAIIGSIPNVRFISNVYDMLVKKDWEYEDGGILDRTHLRFFTEKSLKRTFEEHGFIIEEFKGINARKTKPTSLKKVFRIFLQLAFGQDMQYRQFAFRIKSK